MSDYKHILKLDLVYIIYSASCWVRFLGSMIYHYFYLEVKAVVPGNLRIIIASCLEFQLQLLKLGLCGRARITP